MKFRLNSLWIGILVVFCVNLLLKLLYLDARDVAMDEPFSIWWAGHSVPEIFAMLKTENNPPLHFLLLHYWIQLFGNSAFAVRFLSALFSALTAALIFLTGAQFFNRATGLFASLFFTLSVMQMSFAHEARVYALFELLALWNVYLSLKISEAPGKKELWWWLLLCNILLVYAHYFGWIAVGLQLIFLLLLPNGRKQWKPFLTMLIVLLAAYTPNLLTMITRFRASSGGTWVPEPAITEIYGNINRFLNSRWVTLVFLLSAALTILLAVAGKRSLKPLQFLIKDRKLVALTLWFLGGWLLMFLVSLRLPVFLDRYLLFLTPVLYLLMAVVLHRPEIKPWIRLILAGCVAAAMLVTFRLNPDNHRRVKELAQKVQQYTDQHQPVILSPEYAQLELAYYYDRQGFEQYDSTTLRLQKKGIYPVRSLSGVPGGVLDSAAKIIYLDCGTRFAFGTDEIFDGLQKKFRLSDTTGVYSIYKINTFTK